MIGDFTISCVPHILVTLLNSCDNFVREYRFKELKKARDKSDRDLLQKTEKLTLALWHKNDRDLLSNTVKN